MDHPVNPRVHIIGKFINCFPTTVIIFTMSEIRIDLRATPLTGKMYELLT